MELIVMIVLIACSCQLCLHIICNRIYVSKNAEFSSYRCKQRLVFRLSSTRQSEIFEAGVVNLNIGLRTGHYISEARCLGTALMKSENEVGFAGTVHFLGQTIEDCREGCEV
jgi:hypothetical protein